MPKVFSLQCVHVSKNMMNVLHIKLPKQKYEEQNHAVSLCAHFFSLVFDRCIFTLLIHATSDIQIFTVCHKYGLKYTVMRMKVFA